MGLCLLLVSLKSLFFYSQILTGQFAKQIAHETDGLIFQSFKEVGGDNYKFW